MAYFYTKNRWCSSDIEEADDEKVDSFLHAENELLFEGGSNFFCI